MNPARFGRRLHALAPAVRESLRPSRFQQLFGRELRNVTFGLVFCHTSSFLPSGRLPGLYCSGNPLVRIVDPRKFRGSRIRNEEPASHPGPQLGKITPVKRRLRPRRPDSARVTSRRAKGRLDRFGVLCNDDKQDARRPSRLPMTLFPVLNRIQRETKLGGKLRLAQPQPGTQLPHVHLRRRNIGELS